MKDVIESLVMGLIVIGVAATLFCGCIYALHVIFTTGYAVYVLGVLIILVVAWLIGEYLRHVP